MAHEFDKDYWEQHWQQAHDRPADHGAPHPYLAQETGGLAPGTALDAGCGTGAEAIWLASHGWQVTAADISAQALARAAQRAAGSDVSERVRWVEADLTAWEPGTLFDLVMTHYAHPAMPQLAFYDRICRWVAPGGTLLIVGHLHTAATAHGHASAGAGHEHSTKAAGHGHEHGHAAAADAGHQHGHSAAAGGHEHGHGHGHSAAAGGHEHPPAEASVTVADITAGLDTALWEIVTAAEHVRTVPGRDLALHDVVVRATRRP